MHWLVKMSSSLAMPAGMPVVVAWILMSISLVTLYFDVRAASLSIVLEYFAVSLPSDVVDMSARNFRSTLSICMYGIGMSVSRGTVIFLVNPPCWNRKLTIATSSVPFFPFPDSSKPISRIASHAAIADAFWACMQAIKGAPMIWSKGRAFRCDIIASLPDVSSLSIVFIL